MGWLLHSKLFKQKLTKWIIMYIAIMCLLGSVITYSKYITSLQTSDSSRTAKFNVTIKPVEKDYKCTGEQFELEKNNQTVVIDDKCSLTTRPTKIVEYLFTIDYSELEVNTDIIVRLAFSSDIMNYQNFVLYEIDNNEVERPLFEIKGQILRENGSTLSDDKYSTHRGASNSVLLTDKFDINSTNTSKIKNFKITLESYNVDHNSEGEYVFDTIQKHDNLINVGYTATQKLN